MPSVQNFRSAIGGFNRQDVANYIEYLNFQHESQIAQLTTQLQNAQEALDASAQDSGLQDKLDAALARCADLESRLAAVEASPAAVAAPVIATQPQPANIELETYRRAERVERMAQERAAQIHEKANAILADATVKVESAAKDMDDVAKQVAQQLEVALQRIQEAVNAMYELRPEEE